jgi:hypothetical protein
MNTLSPNALGIAIGALWAGYVLFCGITAMFGWGNALVAALSSLYLGYGPSIAGAIIGAVWAFVDGYVGGLVVAWLYNKLAK